MVPNITLRDCRKIDIESIMRSERDDKRLAHLFTTFNRNIAQFKTNYQRIIELSNKGTFSLFSENHEYDSRSGAKVNGFSNGAAMWLSSFDMSTKNSPPAFDVMQKVEQIYQQIAPFYKQVSTVFDFIFLPMLAS